MPSDIFGVPTHPLVVHAVVALVPLAALLGVLVAVWPHFRRQFALPSAVVALLALVSVPLATSSGENLRARLPETPLIRRHAELADGLLPVVIVLAVALVGLTALQRYRPVATSSSTTRPASAVADASTATRMAALALAVVAGLAGIASAVQVGRIGHAGAKATYQGTPTEPRPDARHG